MWFAMQPPRDCQVLIKIAKGALGSPWPPYLQNKKNGKSKPSNVNPSPGTLGEPDTSGGTDMPDRMFWRSDSWIGTTFPAVGVVLLLSLLVVVVLPCPDSEM
ncbi:hypothetical protein E2C01_002787 [Portunus trituberculatus]|uniref:Uncharacterized protein n=1 Tax=Portunus trituberculatus TaxID=210409 RepID=A0A5B7CKV2_PORTR|nr:hypothetical protein [Portunus trituberculatus]